MSKITPLFKSFGGKNNMWKEIAQYFLDNNEYNIYIEPFAATYALGLHTMPQVDIEIINDLNGNIINLYKTIQNKDTFNEFKGLCDLTPYSEELREEYIKNLSNKNVELDDVTRAFQWFYINRTSHNGTGGFSVNISVRRNMSKSISDYLSCVDGLINFHQRLSHCVITNRDGVSLVEKYGDNQKVFMYCDPPYVWSTRTSARYEVDMPTATQVKFVDACIAAKCKLLISGYDNEIYAKLENNGFQKLSFEVKTISAKGEKKTKTEWLWKNY
jgi:DNA adenine methylase